ncbi:hypothetical protein FSARC_2608 [Fusarium sarcochroum]|uniref:Uncharacterized protein n=1 Tax=Fusarium sarcochroum TaxID=1208366 RepID=A0A8H4XCV1_9HYPO|nr:hypothetical protein FSARC_2608 [Fusarium sarcochroum]
MSCYEAVRDDDRPVSPIECSRSDLSLLKSGSDAPPQYEAIPEPEDGTETKSYSEAAIDLSPPSTSIPISIKSRTRRQHLCDRIGSSGLLVLVLGTAVILVSSSILVFLWVGAQGARDRRRQTALWNHIVFHDWFTRVVTICSATIRISLAFQIGFITAATAAIIIERSGSKFCDIAIVSIQRASSTNASPSNILPAAFRQYMTSGFLELHCLLILLSASAIALVSTFTSTILLSDFGPGHVTAPSVTDVLPLGLYTTTAFTEYDVGLLSCIRSKPSANWRFAEHKASSKELGDTGDIYRALLPFTGLEARASLEYYSGPGLVNNHRTICVSPNLEDLELNYTRKTLVDSEYYFQGKMEIVNEKFQDRLQIGGEEPVSMGCAIKSIWYGDTDWPLSTCQLNNTGSAFVWEKGDVKDKLYGLDYNFFPIMLINASDSLKKFAPEFDLDKDIPLEFHPEDLQNFTTETEDIWTRVFTGNGTQVLSATVCLVNTMSLPLFNITMSGRPTSSEPVVDYRWLSTGKNNTRHLQQIGIGESVDDPARRGILDLQVEPGIGPIEDVNMDDRTAFQKHESLLRDLLSEESPSSSWSLVTNITDSSLLPSTARPEHSKLVQEILKTTRDPAQAIHALVFRFSQMLYYAYQPNFDIKRNVTTIHSLEKLIPIQWTGLAIVLAALSVHFIVLIITTVLFILQTKASLLGNAWQAVSQVVSPQTKEIVEAPGADAMRDKDVQAWAKATGRDSHVYHF